MTLKLSSDEHDGTLTTLVNGFQRTDLVFMAAGGEKVFASKALFYLISELLRNIVSSLSECVSEQVITVHLPGFHSKEIKNFVDIASVGNASIAQKHDKDKVLELAKVLQVNMKLDLTSQKYINDSGINIGLSVEYDKELGANNVVTEVHGDDNDNTGTSAMTDFAASDFSNIVHESTRLSSSPSGFESDEATVSIKQVRVMLKNIDKLVNASDLEESASEVVNKTVSRSKKTLANKNTEYVCNVCDKNMQNKRGLLSHYTLFHYKQEFMQKFEQELNYTTKCNICEKTFKDVNIRSRLLHVGVSHSKILSLIVLEPSKKDKETEVVQISLPYATKSLQRKPQATVMNQKYRKPRARKRHSPIMDITSSDESFLEPRPKRSAKKPIPKKLEAGSQHKCKVCGKLKKNKMKLFEHYTMSHFYTEMTEQYLGLLSARNECNLCGQSCRYSENVSERFIKHVGARHGKILEVLNAKGL